MPTQSLSLYQNSMKRNKFISPFVDIFLFSLAIGVACVATGCCDRKYDVVIVGAGTSGTAAAIQAARSGADVLLVEEHEWLGGMLTSAGVSATDGSYKLRGGIWDEFRDSLEAYYGGADALKTGWVSNVMFEPSVGARIFRNIAAREKNLEVRYNTVASGFEHLQDGWKVTLDTEGKKSSVTGGILVDGTELGDVAAAIGIPYDIGMESRHDTHEDVAPEKANGIIQDLTYVMILQEYDHPVPVPEPDGYNVSEFACCCTNPVCKHPKEEYRMWGPEDMITYGKLPNGKYMINWPLGIRGMVRFSLNDMVSPYSQSKPLYRTAIASGDYPVDHHHTRYSGWEELPNLYFHPVPSYGLPIGVMMPREYDDVLVIEKSISVTNIANGSTRLQPVVLQLGQAAGVVAAQAVRKGCSVSDVSVREVQKELLDCGVYLLPLRDLESGDPHFSVLQRIALTGILRYQGMTVDWENQSWIYADKTLSAKELLDGFCDFYCCLRHEDGTPVSFSGLAVPDGMTDAGWLASLVAAVSGDSHDKSVADVLSVLGDEFGKEYSASTELTRLECAVAVDALLDPFGRYDVDIYGRLKDAQERLMWVDLSANWERFNSLDSVKFYCDRIARAGMTSIVLDVKGTGSDVPYESKFTPQLKEWKGVKAPDFDYIREFSAAARANGLKIYCSVNTFAEGHGIFKKGLIYDGHPEWQAVNYVPGEGLRKQTEIKGKTVLFTNPALPEVRRHMCDILAELVTDFDIDGVILDRGRYDNIQSDFSDFSRAEFEKYIGRKVERFPEDIYEWVKDTDSDGYVMKKGELFRQWIEWRASVIYTFFEEARKAVKDADPDAVFGAYTGAWYPSYYEVGVNWASKDYDPSRDFDWATENYRNYGYAELLDLYTNGNYYPLVTLDEYRKSSGTYRNETDSSISSGEHLCVEGACLYSRELLGPDNPFLGGMYVEDYRNNPEQFRKAVRMNLDKSDGLMVFDLVHIVNFGWWDDLAAAIRGL